MNLAKKIFLKNKQTIFFFMIILCTFHLVSCTWFDGELSDKQRSVNRLIHRTARKIQGESGLIPCGTGAQMMNQVQMLALAFDYYGPITIEKGRELLVSAVESFTEEINKDEKIRPYLYEYPFSPQRVEIRIFCMNKDGSDPPPDKLQVIRYTSGELKFLIDSDDSYFFKTVCQETYEEALGKCSTSKITLHRSS